MKNQIRNAARFVPMAMLAMSAVKTFAQGEVSENNAAIDTIEVVGTQTSIESARAEAAATPGGIEVIDMHEFRERNVSNLADVLRYAPGIWSASHSGTDDIFFSSRGSNLDATHYDMNGIKLLQDGLPVTTADGNNHNRIVDPLAARYAVVARGANAMAYGASTLGGAINFESVTAHDHSGTTVALNGGSFGQAQLRLTAGGEFDEIFDGLATLETRTWDGYREHNEQQRFGIYGNGGWQISEDVAFRGYLTWLSNDQKLAGALSRQQVDADPDQAEAAAVSGNYQLNVDTLRLAGKLSWQLGGAAQFEAGLSYEQQSLYHPIVDRILVDFDGPGPMPPVEVFSLLIDTNHEDVGGMLRYRQTKGAHDFTFGANLGFNKVDGGNYRNLGGKKNGLSTEIDNDAASLEVFLMDHWKVADRWTLTLAVQGVRAARDVRNLEVESGTLSAPSDTYTSVNPRLGAIFDLSDDVALYANASRLFEPPTNFELQDDASGGDATLNAMHGTVFEIGTRGGYSFGRDNRWGWDVSLYFATIRDEILSLDDPSAPGTSLATNVDSTTHAGLELLLNANCRIGDGAAIQPLLSLTVNHFEFDDDPVYGSKRLPAAPDYALRAEFIYRSDRGWFAGPTFEVVGKRFADFTNNYVVDGYSLLGLRGGWSGPGWNVYADLGNVLDADYVSTHYVRDLAEVDAAILFPGAPRSIFIGVERDFR